MNNISKSEQPDITNLSTYEAGILQATSSRMLQKRCDEILKPFGITKTQWLIVGTLHDSGVVGMRVSDLSNLLFTSIPYLTKTLNILERKNIVQRKNNKTDSRSKVVSIDPTFTPQCKSIEKTLRSGLRDTIYAKIAPKDFQTYFDVLRQLKHTEMQKTE